MTANTGQTTVIDLATQPQPHPLHPFGFLLSSQQRVGKHSNRATPSTIGYFKRKRTNKMKRMLALATAGLSLAGVAQAQSSVTLYGIVDLNISQTKAGSNVGGTSVTAMNDGSVNGMNGSRWGMRVSEDLGGGLKAGAVLESGFTADTGASGQGGRLFGRQVFASLSSSNLGELRLGRQYTAHDIVLGITNPFGNGMVLNPGIGVSNRGKALPQFIDAPRIDNMVQYQTPSWSGFVGRLQYALGENVNDKFMSASAGYTAGKLALAASYEWNKDRISGKEGVSEILCVRRFSELVIG